MSVRNAKIVGRGGAAAGVRLRSRSARSAPCGTLVGWMVMVGGALLCGGLLWLPAPVRAAEPSALEAATAIQGALVDAIAAAEPAVVSIARVRPADALEAARAEGELVPSEFGTGVIVDAGGAILTCAHVISKDPESAYFVTTADRRRYRARIKAADPRSDLAILEIPASNLPVIKFGDAKTLRKGMIVVALGNPYAIARDGQVSASWGIVSNLSRKLGPEEGTSPKPTLHHFGTLIQTDAKLNWGTSGGALINLQGEMVGLTTSVAAIAGFEQPAGYAIPVDETFRRAVDNLKEGREVEYGFLGVRPVELSEEQTLRGESGALIQEVVRGAPGDRANLRSDDVVLAVDGQRIHDVDGLMLEVGKLPAGAEARLTVQREGRVIQLIPKLAKYPVEGRKIVTAPQPEWRGMQLDYVTADRERAAATPLPLDRSWIVVTKVAADSPAAAAGLSEKMLVTHVGGTPVQAPQDFFAAVAGRDDAVEITTWSPTEMSSVKQVPPPSK